MSDGCDGGRIGPGVCGAQENTLGVGRLMHHASTLGVCFLSQPYFVVDTTGPQGCRIGLAQSIRMPAVTSAAEVQSFR